MIKNIPKKLRRIVNRGNIVNLFTAPQSLRHALAHEWKNGLGPVAESLLEREFVHVASFTSKNAGDTLLPTVLRDLFSLNIGGIEWRAQHVYDGIGSHEVRKLNRAKALVLGGGGLFLGDTNRNSVSGWQWPISEANIRNLSPKLIVFAVGYNKFRGQDEFGGNFTATVRALAERSVFFGLRNHGSIESIKSYLPIELHEKVRFQPCMTTVLRNIYPLKFQAEESSTEKVIALNCAFDRSHLRFGANQAEILRTIARVMQKLSENHRLCYFSHSRNDDIALDALAAENVPIEHVRLYDMPPGYVIDCYKKAKLTIGMRGHAQMIPFGCGGAILSLISHNKMRWFLDDIRCPDLGVEIESPTLYDDLLRQCESILGDMDNVTRRLDAARANLWDITSNNMSEIRQALQLQ